MLSREDDRLRDLLLARLDGLPLRIRSMFGGYGLYMEDVFFGIIFAGRVYFRTDEESRAAYIARGMPALQPRYRPRGKRTVGRNFQVPGDVLDDHAAIREWALLASTVRRT